MLAALGLQRAPTTGRRGRAVAGLILGVIAVPILLLNTWVTVETMPTDSTTVAAPSATTSSAPTHSASAGESSAGQPLQDRVFLETLRKSGIQFANEADATVSARHGCESMDGGMTPQRVLSSIQGSGSWTRNQAGEILGAAIGAYCPRYLYLLGN
ncbi:DUF732 domain-containing protein [Actinomycetospora termitidis]|uniref:DUF732 domain-containing protein n=1 Tax=Actinomycetospora termitidis TaxID=3053470 RepID=A0ABT7MIZ5_9PSEU|nr:DUF732 domain-containing protein [Actinomycetospora sp. Odt1-22]MDL5160595.1 DUF732 domain-containing protein [Actinomycetospora sp. Odt1-22]